MTSIKRWWWVAVVGLFALCVTLKLNGSSVGVWQKVLNEPEPVRGLLLFKPEEIRIDEWSHITPSIIAQARHSPPFPIENESLGSGRSPLLMSVPVAYYTTIFRPQLWGFFFLDIERAFAFYWCCKVFALPLAVAWLLQQIGIRNGWIVAFGTTWLFFSSLVQWWFSSPAMLPEMLASWAIATGCAVNLFRPASPFKLAVLLAMFVFFGANFVLCLYPGFQVPLLYVSIAVVVATGAGREHEEWRPARGLALLLTAVVLLVATLVPFWRDVLPTVHILAQTSYPGVIRNSGGGLGLLDLFSGVLGVFESEKRTPFHYDNICEASNFYPLWLPVVCMLASARWKTRTAISPLIVALLLVIFLLGFYCVVPMPEWLARLSLLGLSSERRLLLGEGVANVLLCCAFFDSTQARTWPKNGMLAVAIGLLVLAAGLLWLRPFPENSPLSMCIAGVNALLVALLIWQPARWWFLGTFAALVALNGLPINPVMRGLSPLLDSQAFREVDKWRAADPQARWVLYEDASCAQLVKATGASVLNGVKILPDLDFMRQLDPGGRYAWIYNRFAYFNVGLPADGSDVVFRLNGQNIYEFTLPPEHPALRSNGYRYLVFPRLWINASLHGFTFVEKIEPSELYIYKRLAQTGE